MQGDIRKIKEKLFAAKIQLSFVVVSGYFTPNTFHPTFRKANTMSRAE